MQHYFITLFTKSRFILTLININIYVSIIYWFNFIIHLFSVTVLSRVFGELHSNSDGFYFLLMSGTQHGHGMCKCGLCNLFVLNTSEVPQRCKCLFDFIVIWWNILDLFKMCVVRNYQKLIEKIRVKWEFIVCLFYFQLFTTCEIIAIIKVLMN